MINANCMVAKIIFIIMALCMSTGCAGTLASRTEKSFVGKYPFYGTAFDGTAIFLSCNPWVYTDVWYSRPLFFGIGLISIPVDVTVDAILLPADLVCWPFGMEKKIGKLSIY